MEFKRFWHQPNVHVNQNLILNEVLVPVFALKELWQCSHIVDIGLVSMLMLLLRFLFWFSLFIYCVNTMLSHLKLCGMRCKEYVWNETIMIMCWSYTVQFVIVCIYFHGASSFNELQLRYVDVVMFACVLIWLVMFFCCCCSLSVVLNFPSTAAPTTVNRWRSF